MGPHNPIFGTVHFVRSPPTGSPNPHLLLQLLSSISTLDCFTLDCSPLSLSDTPNPITSLLQKLNHKNKLDINNVRPLERDPLSSILLSCVEFWQLRKVGRSHPHPFAKWTTTPTLNHGSRWCSPLLTAGNARSGPPYSGKATCVPSKRQSTVWLSLPVCQWSRNESEIRRHCNDKQNLEKQPLRHCWLVSHHRRVCPSRGKTVTASRRSCNPEYLCWIMGELFFQLYGLLADPTTWFLGCRQDFASIFCFNSQSCHPSARMLWVCHLHSMSDWRICQAPRRRHHCLPLLRAVKVLQPGCQGLDTLRGSLQNIFGLV